MQILLVDDDLSHAELLTVYLQAHGYHLAHCADPRLALPYLGEHEVDVILLDVNMPHMSGVDLCVMIRAHYDLPLIMLTERAELSDRVLGLELGADDYLAKPFEPPELVSRIKAVAKRYQRSLASGAAQDSSVSTPQNQSTTIQSQPVHTQTSNHIQVGEVSLDVGRREARLRDQHLPLSTIEWDTLYILAKSPGRVFSRDEIVSLLHGANVELVTRSVDITVSRLRTHLNDDPKSPQFIKTVWGAGYTFLPQDG